MVEIQEVEDIPRVDITKEVIVVDLTDTTRIAKMI